MNPLEVKFLPISKNELDLIINALRFPAHPIVPEYYLSLALRLERDWKNSKTVNEILEDAQRRAR